MQTKIPRWAVRQGRSTATVRALNIDAARTRAAQIGMRDPQSVVLVTDAATDAKAAGHWHCATCGRLSSIGDKPVRNPCKCAELGD